MLLAILVLATPACAGRQAGPSPRSTETDGPPRSIPALQLAVLDAVGGALAWCDPDIYPVSVDDPLQVARRRLTTIRALPRYHSAILEYMGVDPSARLTDEQVIRASNLFKQMLIIDLEADGQRYRFSVDVDSSDDTGTQTVTGTVSRSGLVDIEGRRPGPELQCPICLPSDAAVDTPSGPVPIRKLVPGMSVWTLDLEGRRIEATVVLVASAPAPPRHRLARVVLTDGRTVLASPGHPLEDGRPIGTLRPGDRVAGSTVVSMRLVPYAGTATHDLLPAGPTGVYFVDGIPLRSTLLRR